MGRIRTANAAFTSVLVEKQQRLESPPIAISSAGTLLSFRNKFDTQFDGTVYWDGGVCERSSPNINGGAFTDVTDPAVGGSCFRQLHQQITTAHRRHTMCWQAVWLGQATRRAISTPW